MKLDFLQYFPDDSGFFEGENVNDFLDWFDQPNLKDEFNEEWDWLALALSNPKYFNVVFGSKTLWIYNEVKR